MSRFRKIFILLLLITLGVLAVLYFTGFWSDQKIALRELKKLEEPATSERAQEAVMAQEYDLLKVLGRAGVDFNAPNEHGNTALHLACQEKDWAGFHLLREFEADPDLANQAGMNATSMVLEADELDLATTLLEEGASADFQAPTREPALVHYLRNDQIEKALVLLRYKADPNAIGANQEHPLYVALAKGQREAAAVLLAAGADANAKTPQNEPLLNYFLKNYKALGFSESGATVVLGNFLLVGADIESQDLSGWRPLQWAIHNRFHQGVEKLLLQTKDVSGCLWLAFKNEDYGTARIILQKGANPNERGPGGHTPLHAMIRADRADLVKELLDHGVSSEQVGMEGQSALISGIGLRKTNATLALLNHENKPHHSTLMAHPVSEEYRDLFGRKGLFDWYCRNAKGLTPLMAAVMQGDHEVVKKLLELGADPVKGTDTRYKVFPIQMAAKRKDVKMQQIIIGAPYKDDEQERNFVIDLSAQTVKYYKGGELLKTSRVSTGRSGFRTQTGTYVITDKTRHKKSNIYDAAPMPYFQRFSCGAIGFHEGNTYSRYASHGCIRLPMSVAKYFFGQTKLGDRVEIVD